MTIREQIFSMLQAGGEEYTSGEAISQQLGITRAAVWKHIRALQAEGFEIEGVTRLGYRLVGVHNTLCAPALSAALTTQTLGRNTVFLQRTDSTNLVAKQLAHEGCPSGTVVVSEAQVAGRGRRGRTWFNAPGKDICMSAVLRPKIESRHAPRFTLATALGVYNLAASLGLAPSIKWPNDVLVAGKKICGILLEMEGTFDALSWLVVGFGLNVNTTAFPEELIHIATSLAAECGRELNRSDIMAQLLNNLEPLFDACAQESSFQSLLSQYRECCATIGQTLTVTGVAEQLQGVAEGIDEMGMLLLRTADGVLHAVAAGDVTLRADALANETGE